VCCSASPVRNSHLLILGTLNGPPLRPRWRGPLEINRSRSRAPLGRRLRASQNGAPLSSTGARFGLPCKLSKGRTGLAYSHAPGGNYG
jgi:hypothetical protein